MADGCGEGEAEHAFDEELVGDPDPERQPAA